MKKLALTIALALAASGLTFAAAGQNKPATKTTATKAKKHKKTKKGANTTAPKEVTAVNEQKAPSPHCGPAGLLAFWCRVAEIHHARCFAAKNRAPLAISFSSLEVANQVHSK